ncbi:rhomboid family intramembrane serine protease [Amycolatopsis sp. NPDC102389]|uniref:rhomboid family intramembrane serine protease n=1 Tax=Amycolatopsis sp. NPDC102389 TaxID=3363941 RepID=UPI00380FE409
MTEATITATLDRLLAAMGRRAGKPVATAAVWFVTAAAGVAQLAHPGLLDQFRRNPAALADGEWWRMVTPMFFQDGHLVGMIFNLATLAVIGALAERLLGPVRWLVVYFGCALIGNAVSYLWLNPTGAGNSMAVCGLLGALATAMLTAGPRFGLTIPAGLRTAALILPALAIVDTVLHDNHGLPLLAGMVLGLILSPRRA